MITNTVRTVRARIARTAALGLAVIVATVGMFAAPPAEEAAFAEPLLERDTAIVITKLLQPERVGTPADGMPLDTAELDEMVPVGGVTFSVKRVPGIDVTTSPGQVEAASLTVAEAIRLTANEPVLASGVTGADGVLTLGGAGGGLGLGVFLVEEADAPAGVVPAAPFLVALPFTTPGGDALQYEAHVYPKNSTVDVGVQVNDASAVSCSDTIVWTTRNAIPHQRSFSKYVTQNILAPGVHLTSLDAVDVRVSGGSSGSLRRGVDFELVDLEAQGMHGFAVDFTQAGRAVLAAARAADEAAEVVVNYPTRVTSGGAHVNEVVLYVDDAAPVADRTVTKFGPLQILVHERGNAQHVIPGSDFRLFRTAEDARAGRNPIVIGGTDTWQTDADGFITVPCLRFSNFANGLDREPSSELFRTYWAQPVSYPAGWIGEPDPLPGLVTGASTADAEVLTFRVWKSAAAPIPGLAVTGGQVVGLGILAGLLAVGGGMLVLRRRGRFADD